MELATLSLHVLCVCVYSCSLVSGLYVEYTCAFILVVPNEVFGASHNNVFGPPLLYATMVRHKV